MSDTAEIQRVGGKVALSLGAKVGLPLLIVGILGGIALTADQKVQAYALAEHKQAEDARLSEIRSDVRLLRDEMRAELQNIRQALDRRR